MSFVDVYSLVISLTEASPEEGRDEASVSLALSCTYVWQVYEHVWNSSFTGQEAVSVFAYSGPSKTIAN